jgi:serine phosphatase RsbU (regulator of sigma subunit)
LASVRFLNGPNQDQSYAVRGGEVVGRDASSAIHVPVPGVSRHHFRFSLEDGGFWATDLSSVNGTWVNKKKVARARLAEGDTITINGIDMVFTLADAPARVATPRPADLAPRPTRRSQKVTDEVPIPKLSDSAIVLNDSKAMAEFQLDASAVHPSTAALRQGKDHKAQVEALQERLHLVFEVSQALGAARERDELFGKIMDKLFEVFPQAGRGFILVGPAVASLEPAIVRHRDAIAKTEEISISRTIATKVFEEKHAILSADASQDFGGAQSIASFEIRSLMVAPLVVRGEVLGFIQLDTKKIAKKFTPDDLNLLLGIASSAAIFLKNLKLFEDVAREVKEREAIQSELRVASRIQAALLPRKLPEIHGLEVSARMKTAKEVGGDYYDVIELPTSPPSMMVAIGDVSGKGVPAGLIMVMARTILRSLAGSLSPRAAAVETNRILKPDLKPGMFLSLLLVRAGAGGVLELAGCGHERPLVYRAATKKVERFELGGTVLGVVADNSKHVAEAKVVLAPGDQLLLYTDGVPEAMDRSEKQYTMDRLEATLATHGARSPADLIHSIEEDIGRHVGHAEQHDDITMIAVRRKPG